MFVALESMFDRFELILWIKILRSISMIAHGIVGNAVMPEGRRLGRTSLCQYFSDLMSRVKLRM